MTLKIRNTSLSHKVRVCHDVSTEKYTAPVDPQRHNVQVFCEKRSEGYKLKC
jgi:hypothetical protein